LARTAPADFETERGHVMSVTDEIIRLFETKGHAAYFGEPVSQLEHALQTADLAAKQGASETLVAAALLHDVGHLVHELPENIADRGIDARHEVVGKNWLTKHFGPSVTEPIRLHVAAKRYLCAVDSEYAKNLSPASVQSLELQGGPMSKAEVAEFERSANWRDAILLRRCDDLAKVPGLNVPGLEHYRAILDGVTDGR
jgi:phosphonate degradation associated HDIG domain protein